MSFARSTRHSCVSGKPGPLGINNRTMDESRGGPFGKYVTSKL